MAKASSGRGSMEEGPEKRSSAPPEPGGAHGVGHNHHHAFPIRVPFFEEFKRRNLGRVAILYVIACYLILEPFELFFHLLELPVWAGRGVVLIMVMGFPAVLLFAWIYEVTPEGLKPTAEVNPSQSIAHKTGQRLNRAIIAVLSIALAYFIADKFWISKYLGAGRPEHLISQRVVTVEDTNSSEGSGKAASLGEKSIVVLPFTDMSEKHDQEYFSDGLTEELIDRLAHSPDLMVIARTSAFAFKGKNEDIRTIAATLGVAHLLEGSVRKAGNTLRITAQLIRASDGVHLWSQSYDRNLADVLKIQDEISATVASALKVVLKATYIEPQSSNPDAYSLYLKGEYFKKRFTKEDTDRAIDYFKRAIDLDPSYASALVSMAICFEDAAIIGWIPPLEGRKMARDAAEKALKLNPNLASAYSNLGFISMALDWDWNAARENYRRAKALNPESLSIAADLAEVEAIVTGRFDERISIEKKLVSRDPLDDSSLYNLAGDLFLAGRFKEAVAVARQVILLNPQMAGAHSGLAFSLLSLGRLDDALAEAKMEADESWRLATLPVIYWALGRKADSDTTLKELEAKHADGSAFNIAWTHAYRGEVDLAFQWLERAYRQQEFGMAFLLSDPYLQNIRKDPRFHELLVRMKLDGEPISSPQ